MIPKISGKGRSFSGLAQYLLHDPKAKTSERVAWTHTLNLTHDDPASAVDEMLWTYRNAELLKQEAGIRPGGRKADRPALHFSLNWAEDQTPGRDEMIAAVKDYMRHVGLSEHQALLVAHTDKDRAEVHVMLNRIHPESGLAARDKFDKKRSQEWALEYEREHGKIYCEERLKPPEEREKAPTRETWQAFKESEREFEKSEAARRKFDSDYLERLENRKIINSEEWSILREHQRAEREGFFASGKQEFTELRKEIYREVREEFRSEWAEFYAQKKAGGDADALAEMRDDIIERQKAVLEERRDEACASLREARDAEYRVILDAQKEMRAELTDRQEQGLSSPELLDLVNQKPGADAFIRHEFEDWRSTPAEPSPRDLDSDRGGFQWPDLPSVEPSHGDTRPALDIAGNLSMGMIGGFAGIGEALFDGFFGQSPTPKQPQPERPRPPPPEFPRHNPFTAFAEEARQAAERQQEASDRAWWDERYARHRD